MNSLTVVDPERFLGSVRWRQLFDMDEQIHAQIARLESDVQHIHIVVSDIKVDLRRTNDKIDATNSRVDVLRDKLEQGFREVNARVDGVQERLTGKIEGVREDLTQKIEGVREDLTSVRHDIASMKVWAMGLYFALAGSLLFVMAKGFKWL